MLIYNVDFEVAGIALSVLLLVFISVQYSVNDSIKKIRNAITCNILAAAFDAWTVVFYSFPDRKYLWANYLVNSLCFYFGVCTACAILSYLIEYLNNKRGYNKYKIWTKINRIVIISFAFLMIVNVFWPLVFTFDEEANYMRVGIYPIVYAIPAFYVIVFTVFLIKDRKYLSFKQHVSLATFAVFTITGMALQFFIFPDIFLSYFASSMAILCMSFTLETPDYQMLLKTMDELSEAKNAAEQATYAKDSFLANMSHEIRTPLNSILGMDEMILRDSKEPKIKYYAADIRRAGNSLLSIINDILDVSKIESGNMELIEEEYDVAALISDVVTITKVKAEKKNIDYFIRVPESMPSVMFGDYVRLRQIMVNIIDNAIKYTQHGSVTINIEWDRIRRNDDYADIVIKVEDTGIGIKEEDMGKLFQSFKRLDEKRNRKVEGTGLGLTLTKKLVEMIGGSIEVESEYGIGSTFTIYYSQKIINDKPIGDISDAVAKVIDATKAFTPTLTAPRARILCVDDNEMNLDVFVNLMETSRVKIDLAISGQEALMLCKEKKYDMIFLDQMMPEMDGAETLREMRRQELIGDTPVIALTADAIVGAREFYLSNGFDEYIAKPVRYPDVEKLMYKFFRSDLIIELDNTEEVKVEEEEVKPELLVIDESSEVLKAHKQKLDGYNVRLVRSRAEADKYMEKHSPEFVLLKSSELKK